MALNAPLNLPNSNGRELFFGLRRIRLTWHKLRRYPQDTAFLHTNFLHGAAIGASMEVDLRRTASGDWVCLSHDYLERETSGSGKLSETDTATLRRLRLRNSYDGKLGDPPLFLDDIANAITASTGGAHNETHLQMDLKESVDYIDDTAIANFTATITPIAGHCTLSGRAWPAVATLGEFTPGLELGFDPFYLIDSVNTAFTSAAAVEDFIGRVLDTAPQAHALFLNHRLIGQALDLGVNPVSHFQRAGKTVDCWTLDAYTPRAAENLLMAVAAGVDRIITNSPYALQTLWARTDQG